MERTGGECWVNINDGTNAIGIKMKTADARRITHYGNYKQKGDTVWITETFYKACREDGGETDIHVVDLKIVTPGSPTEEPVATSKVIGAVLLAAITISCLLFSRHKRTAYRH